MATLSLPAAALADPRDPPQFRTRDNFGPHTLQNVISNELKTSTTAKHQEVDCSALSNLIDYVPAKIFNDETGEKVEAKPHEWKRSECCIVSNYFWHLQRNSTEIFNKLKGPIKLQKGVPNSEHEARSCFPNGKDLVFTENFFAVSEKQGWKDFLSAVQELGKNEVK